MTSELPLVLRELQTPCLVLREDIFEENLIAMSLHCRSQGISLRPHAKTHKSAAVAHEQIHFGAQGVCCATLNEAEKLHVWGVDDILITSPVVSTQAFKRLRTLNETCTSLAVVVDSELNLNALEKLFSNKPLNVLLDVDPGMHRTGVEPGPEALKLAQHITDCTNLDFTGVQFYAGNLMHVRSFDERKLRAQKAWDKLNRFLDTLETQGIPCDTVSGGGTGTWDIDCQFGTITELQAGSYPFMDRDYLDNEWESKSDPPFKSSLFVLTTVVSSNHQGNATTDAGLKAFATDSGLPRVFKGASTSAQYIFKGDEHGGVIDEDGESNLQIGDQLLVVPPHCDPTINLYDRMIVVDENWIEQDSFEVVARGGR